MKLMEASQKYKQVLKGVIFGGIFGIVGVLIAPLGLGIAFIEFIRPLLIPGIDLVVNPLQDAIPVTNTANLLLWGALSNILIFAILGGILTSIKSSIHIERKIKIFLTIFIILVFFGITGMLTHVYFFLVSPNKSWIFKTGA